MHHFALLLSTNLCIYFGGNERLSPQGEVSKNDYKAQS